MTEREIIQENIEKLYSSCVEENRSELSFLGLLAGVEKRLCIKVLEGFAELLVDKPDHFAWCEDTLRSTHRGIHGHDLNRAFCQAWAKARKTKGLKVENFMSPLYTLDDVRAMVKHWDSRWGVFPGIEKALTDNRFRESVLSEAELLKQVQQTPV